MQQFVSKKDPWLVAVLVIAMVAQVVGLVVILTEPVPAAEKFITAAVIILTTLLVVSILLRTYYVVDKGNLRVVSGPFRWNIAIRDIRAVDTSRSAWSSPALSLDRLRIRYGKHRRIMVSPEDKPGFLRAIGQGTA